MDRISFEIRRSADRPELAININGRSLEQHVTEIDQRHIAAGADPNLASNFVSLSPADFLPAAPIDLDRPPYDEKIPILGCCCRECGPSSGAWLLVRITVTSQFVIWSDFELPSGQSYGTQPWTYDQLGPFVFDRRQYLAALADHAPPREPNQIAHVTIFCDPVYGWALDRQYGVELPASNQPLSLVLGDSAHAGLAVTLQRSYWNLLPLQHPRLPAGQRWWIVDPDPPSRWSVILLPAAPAALRDWLRPWADVQALEAEWRASPLWNRVIDPHNIAATGISHHLTSRAVLRQVEHSSIYRLEPLDASYARTGDSLQWLPAFLARCRETLLD